MENIDTLTDHILNRYKDMLIKSMTDLLTGRSKTLYELHIHNSYKDICMDLQHISDKTDIHEILIKTYIIKDAIEMETRAIERIINRTDDLYMDINLYLKQINGTIGDNYLIKAYSPGLSVIERNRNGVTVNVHNISIEIMNIFERYLKRENIYIPDKDKKGDTYEDVIFGDTYKNLIQDIENIVYDYFLERSFNNEYEEEIAM